MAQTMTLPGIGEGASGIGAARIVQVLHLAGVAAREPFVAMGRRNQFRCGSDTAEIEAEGLGFGDEPFGIGLRAHGTIVLCEP